MTYLSKKKKKKIRRGHGLRELCKAECSVVLSLLYFKLKIFLYPLDAYGNFEMFC